MSSTPQLVSKAEGVFSESLAHDESSEAKEAKTEFYIGETAELDKVQTTLIDVTESTGSEYNQPNEGNVFVLCEFEICNNSDTEIAVSSMLSFEAYCDDYTCSGSFSALLEKGDKNQLDGTVAAGKKFKGVVGYEVPEDWKELEIRYTPDYWNGNDIVFIANQIAYHIYISKKRRRIKSLSSSFLVIQRGKKHLFRDRRWGKPNLRGHLPMPCRVQRRFPDRRVRGHRHNRRDTHIS